MCSWGGGLGEDRTATKTPRGEEQRTYYYNGIGTREDGEDIPLVGWLVSKVTGLVNSALAPRWGDARRILKEAMGDFDGAEPKREDRIVVFGFSRGAALARKFASMVLTEHEALEVAFLGVFDTVAAMDGIHRRGETISSDVVFEDGTVNPRVNRAVHILSLDEDRIAFEPTQMNRDPGDAERIHEIWFPGVHSDIGGGYWHDGLADVTLTYMIGQCKARLKEDINIAMSSARTISEVLDSQGDILRMLDVDDILIHPNDRHGPRAHRGSRQAVQQAGPQGVRGAGRQGALEHGVSAAGAPLGQGPVRPSPGVPAGRAAGTGLRGPASGERTRKGKGSRSRGIARNGGCSGSGEEVHGIARKSRGRRTRMNPPGVAATAA